MIRPSRLDHVEVAIRVQVHQLGESCNLAEAIRNRRKIIDAIIKNGFAKLLEPFRAYLLVGRSLDQDRQQLLQRPAHGIAKRAR